MKCGQETAEGQVFCQQCLDGMAEYPVSPDTPVHLPQRKNPVPDKKASRKKELTPAQTIQLQKGTIRWLTVTVAVLALIIGVLAGVLIYTLGDTPRRPLAEHLRAVLNVSRETFRLPFVSRETNDH